MRTKIFHFLLLNFVFSYSLIAMEDGVSEGGIQPSPVADKKIGEEQPSAIPSQITEPNNGNPPSRQLSEKKNIESLDEKLENMHIGDTVIADTGEFIKQDESLLDKDKAPDSDLHLLPAVQEQEVDLRNISELLELISSHISYVIEHKKVFQQDWGLGTIIRDDDWLSNEFIADLISGHIADVNPKLPYSIMDPVDVSSNWWDLTRQILQSIEKQLKHEKRLNRFTIVPINFANAHWAAMIIEQNDHDPSNPTVFFFDSLDSTPDKLNIIETVVKDTQFFKNPKIIDLSSPDLRQKDGKTCGTWMLQAIKFIIQAREKEFQDNDELQKFVHTNLASIDMEAQHAINLNQQRAENVGHIRTKVPLKDTVKTIKDTDKLKQKSEEVPSCVEQQHKQDLDVWIGEEGKEVVKYIANRTAERGHPNSEGQLNRIIEDILKRDDFNFNLKQLHQMAYQELSRLPKYKSSENTNYAFTYDTNYRKVYSSHFLFLFVATNNINLLSLILDKISPNLTGIVDSQGNNILHVSAYRGYHQIMKIIIDHAKKASHLESLLNARNQDGTNPLGMLFLSQISSKDQFKGKLSQDNQFIKSVELIIMEPAFEINRYLNNKRGMDVFAPEDLKRIGGFNCLHVVLKEKYDRILPLLSERNSTLPPEFAVNLCYPAMNPEHHMWHPKKFTLDSTHPDDGVSQAMRKGYEQLTSGIDEEDDDSGDSDDDQTSAWHYKKSLLDLSRFIDRHQEKKKEYGSPSIHKFRTKIDTTVLNSPSKTRLTPEKKAQAEEDITKISVVHFHGVPFMQGQLTNHERREVGKKFIEINEEYMENGLKNSRRNEKLKAIYSRTTTASVGIETHKMLIDSSEEELDELMRINQLLRELLANFYTSETLLNSIKEEKSHQYKKTLKCKYGISSLNGEKKFDTLFVEARKEYFENIFLFVIQKYINDFTMLDTMQFFWKILEMGLRNIPNEIVQYRFPITSTAKSPDHAFKYGMGYNVEESLRGEKPIMPFYKNGTPKHRLAGFLYLAITDLATYRDMENKHYLVDPIQYHKAAKLKLDTNIVHQSEISFLGGIDGRNISLIVPLTYLNFKDKNKELYKRIFNLTESDWRLGKSLKGEVQQRTSGGGTGAHTKEFKLLLKIYLPFVIKLATTISELQDTILHFIDAYGDLHIYSEGTIDDNDTFHTEVQDKIKRQVYGKYEEGRIKTPVKEEKLYHALKPRRLGVIFDELNEQNQKDEKKHLITNVPLQEPAETEKKLEIPPEINQIEDIDLYKKNAESGDGKALDKLKSLAEKGNPHAQFNLARLYRKGAEGVRQDDAEAVRWYIKAAGQEHTLAQYYLGFMYESGSGVQQSKAKAIEWYTKAAEQGDDFAREKLKKLGAV